MTADGGWFRGKVLNIQPQKNFGFINSPQLSKNVYFKIDMVENNARVNVHDIVECQLDPNGENEKSYRALAVRKISDGYPPSSRGYPPQQRAGVGGGADYPTRFREAVPPPHASTDSTWSMGGSSSGASGSVGSLGRPGFLGGLSSGPLDGLDHSAADLWGSPVSSAPAPRLGTGVGGGSGSNGGLRTPMYHSGTDGVYRFDINLNRFRQLPPSDVQRSYGVVRSAVILPSLAKFLSVEPNHVGTIEIHNDPGNFVSFTEQSIWKGWPELDVGDMVEFIVTQTVSGPRAEYIKLLIPVPTERHRGHLIRFLKDKGIGYVKCKSFQQDVYFYFSELYTEDGHAVIPEGAEVEFQLARKGNQADNRPAAHRISLRLVPQRVEAAQGIVQYPLQLNSQGVGIGGNIRIDLANRSLFLPFQESDLLVRDTHLAAGDPVICQLCYHEYAPQPYVVNVATPGTPLPSPEQVIRQAAAQAAANAAEISAAAGASSSSSSSSSGVSSSARGGPSSAVGGSSSSVFGTGALFDALPHAGGHQSGIVILEHLPEYLTPTRQEQKGLIKLSTSDQLVQFDPRGMDPRGMVNGKPGLFPGDHVTFDFDHNGMARHIRVTQPALNTSMGIVINVPTEEKKFGYIKSNDQDKHVFFHSSVWPDHVPCEVGTEVSFLCVFRGADHNPNAVRLEIRPKGSVRVTDMGTVTYVDHVMDEGTVMTASKQQYAFKPSEFIDMQQQGPLQQNDEVEFTLQRDMFHPRIVAVDLHRRPSRKYQSKVPLSTEFDVRIAREPRAPVPGSVGFQLF